MKLRHTFGVTTHQLRNACLRVVALIVKLLVFYQAVLCHNFTKSPLCLRPWRAWCCTSSSRRTTTSSRTSCTESARTRSWKKSPNTSETCCAVAMAVRLERTLTCLWVQGEVKRSSPPVIFLHSQGPSETVHHHGADALGLPGGGLWEGAARGLGRQPRHRRLHLHRGGREEVEGSEEQSGGTRECCTSSVVSSVCLVLHVNLSCKQSMYTHVNDIVPVPTEHKNNGQVLHQNHYEEDGRTPRPLRRRKHPHPHLSL